MPFIPLIASGVATAAGASALTSSLVGTVAGLGVNLIQKNKQKKALAAQQAAGAPASIPSDETKLALMQRQELAASDAERKRLLQEKAQIVGGGRFRRRGAGLSSYAGAY